MSSTTLIPTATASAPRPVAVAATAGGIDWAALEAFCHATLSAYGARFDRPVAARPSSGPGFRLDLEAIPFPDGIGVATVQCVAEAPLGLPRLTLTLRHERVFADSARDAARDHLYFNDYYWAVRLIPAPAQLQAAVSQALAQLEAARTRLSARRAVPSLTALPAPAAALPAAPTTASPVASPPPDR